MLQSHSGVDGFTPAVVGRSPAVWLPCEHEHKHAQRVNADAFSSFSFFFPCCVVFAFKTSCNSSPHQCNRRSEHVACENMTNKSRRIRPFTIWLRGSAPRRVILLTVTAAGAGRHAERRVCEERLFSCATFSLSFFELKHTK